MHIILINAQINLTYISSSILIQKNTSLNTLVNLPYLHCSLYGSEKMFTKRNFQFPLKWPISLTYVAKKKVSHIQNFHIKLVDFLRRAVAVCYHTSGTKALMQLAIHSIRYCLTPWSLPSDAGEVPDLLIVLCFVLWLPARLIYLFKCVYELLMYAHFTVLITCFCLLFFLSLFFF